MTAQKNDLKDNSSDDTTDRFIVSKNRNSEEGENLGSRLI